MWGTEGESESGPGGGGRSWTSWKSWEGPPRPRPFLGPPWRHHAAPRVSGQGGLLSARAYWRLLPSPSLCFLKLRLGLHFNTHAPVPRHPLLLCTSHLQCRACSLGWKAGLPPDTRRQVGRACETQLQGDYEPEPPVAWPSQIWLPSRIGAASDGGGPGAASPSGGGGNCGGGRVTWRSVLQFRSWLLGRDLCAGLSCPSPSEPFLSDKVCGETCWWTSCPHGVYTLEEPFISIRK